MLRTLQITIAVVYTAALPGPAFPNGLNQNANGLCWPPKNCNPPKATYSRVLPAYPHVQWNDAGGYCGSQSIQTTVLVKGAWISEQQVRNHSSPGGGHDNEIIETNIDAALKSLKVKAEGFDYKNTPTPQGDAYLAFLKRHLAEGSPIAWMIMLGSEARPPHYPVYPGVPFGFYSHVEPVFGIFSNHPLNDTRVYDDDWLAHGTNADTHAHYRQLGKLTDNLDFKGNCSTSSYPGYPCVYEQYGFGWAMQDLLDETGTEAFPLSLKVDLTREPDTRSGAAPVQMHATATVVGLTAGEKYVVYRWDSVESAFDYSNVLYSHAFTASADTYVYADENTITSNGVAYYRCVKA